MRVCVKSLPLFFAFHSAYFLFAIAEEQVDDMARSVGLKFLPFYYILIKIGIKYKHI